MRVSSSKRCGSCETRAFEKVEKGQNIPLLGRGGADTHGTITTVHALHLTKCTLLVTLVGKSNKSVASGLPSVGIGHDLGALTRGETGLEERNQHVFGDLRTKVTNEDGILGSTIVPGGGGQHRNRNRIKCENIPSVNKTAARSPVQLELLSLTARHGRASEGESLVGSVGVGELDEAITSVSCSKVSKTQQASKLRNMRDRAIVTRVEKEQMF